jgi:phospholipid/cholesterol/gamma-HCH transport system ATP-binding protein
MEKNNYKSITDEEIIKVNDLNKSFKGSNVLKNVSFTIHKGESVAVIGRSGTGKSVLIKCLVRLIEPDKGSISIFGKDVINLNYQELNQVRTKIGFLFQAGALYDSLTVRENLEFPLLRNKFVGKFKDMNSQIEQVLESVGMQGTDKKMPAELSGGMQKRIGLARSLIMNPEIIFYDEPTTGLDPITSQGINQLILDTQKKHQATSIIITHDMKCAKTTSNRMIILYQGAVHASGTYEELSNSKDEIIQSFFEY